MFPSGVVYEEAIKTCKEIIIIPRKLCKNYSSGVRISVPDIRVMWERNVRGYAEGTRLMAGARTNGYGLLQLLKAFVTAAGVERHRLTALY